MVGTLIDHLARGIAILDFGDCKGGHLALREGSAQPDWCRERRRQPRQGPLTLVSSGAAWRRFAIGDVASASRCNHVQQPHRWFLRLALVRLFQQTALDQPARAAAPGRVGSRTQVSLLDIDQRA